MKIPKKNMIKVLLFITRASSSEVRAMGRLAIAYEVIGNEPNEKKLFLSRLKIQKLRRVIMAAGIGIVIDRPFLAITSIITVPYVFFNIVYSILSRVF